MSTMKRIERAKTTRNMTSGAILASLVSALYVHATTNIPTWQFIARAPFMIAIIVITWGAFKLREYILNDS